jgi:hypothetical protein
LSDAKSVGGAQPMEPRTEVVQMNHGDLSNQKSGVFAKFFLVI